MALVLQNGSLLRSGNALASGSECCCNASQSPYSVCGNLCAFRVQVKELDSEMAACGDELPEGWQLQSSVGCDDIDELIGFWQTPWLEASKGGFGEVCESYEGIVDAESSPKYCFDSERAGITYVPGLIGYVIGGSRGFSRSGWTTEDISDPEQEIVFKSFSMNYDLGIYCFGGDFIGRDEELPDPCPVCNGAATAYPSAYYIAGYINVTCDEIRYQNSQPTGSASRVFQGYLGRFASSENTRFRTQTCDEMNNFTRLSQYDCVETPNEGCRAVTDFYPDDPLEITVSVDDGVTVGGETFEWTDSFSSETANGFSIDFPDDLKNPGGITVYRAAKCCCAGDYCNPLP